jgi:hypothetical protein
MPITHTSESVEGQNFAKGLVWPLRRNPGLTLRKTENLSYGQQMTFSRESIDEFF